MNLYSTAFAQGSAVASQPRRVAVKVANRVLRRLPQRWPLVKYDLGGFPLDIPMSHPLPRILATDDHYLVPLTTLARALHRNGSIGPGIDIGANVGDTAVLMALAGLRHVVCVEGNGVFLGPLRSNAARANARGWQFDIVDQFVGESSTHDSGARVSTKGGTASLIRNGSTNDSAPSLQFVSPADLLAPHASVALLKIDTDGMDMEILSQMLAALDGKPIESVFVEYTPRSEPVVDTFRLLDEAGLGSLFWFDHTGRLVRAVEATNADAIAELVLRGQERGDYFDIAAVRPGSATASELADTYGVRDA